MDENKELVFFADWLMEQLTDEDKKDLIANAEAAYYKVAKYVTETNSTPPTSERVLEWFLYRYDTR